jgi:hypothetical protein
MRRIKYKKLWVGIALMVLLSPLGLMLPGFFGAGGAWGEWAPEELDKILGYIPEGLKRLSGLWNSPLADYAFRGWEEGIKGYAAYIVSGIAGVAFVALLSYIIGKMLSKKNGNR